MKSSNSKKFFCEKCNFKCNSNSQWKIHIMTNKHNAVKKNSTEDNTNNDNIQTVEPEKVLENSQNETVQDVVEIEAEVETKQNNIVKESTEDGTHKHKCACGKTYKYKQGLSVHKKKCTETPRVPEVQCKKEETEVTSSEKLNVPDLDKFLMNTIKDLVTQHQEFTTLLVNQNMEMKTMMNENKEFKDMIIQQTSKLIETNKSSTITNNIQNNKFNLNIFLNEECKDAINITDYVDKMELQLEDLEVTAQLGYTDGITKIISDRIRETSLTKRPFHCTDGKREIVYVKDNDIWEKEQSDKPRMRKMITNVIHKNLQQLIKWHQKYPECGDSHNTKSTEYLNIMIEANGGQEREKKEEQILRNILKEALLK
jgi:hypothetical protein